MINAAALGEIEKEKKFVADAAALRQELIDRNTELGIAQNIKLGPGPSQANQDYPDLQEMLRLKQERKGLFINKGYTELQRRKKLYKKSPEHMHNLVTREEKGMLDGYNRAALAEIRAEEIPNPENIGHIALQAYNHTKRDQQTRM